MNALPAHFENFIQSMTTQNKFPSFDKLVKKLFLEKQKREMKFGKQRREVKFGKQRNDEALFFQTRQNLSNNKKKLESGWWLYSTNDESNCGNEMHVSNKHQEPPIICQRQHGHQMKDCPYI